MSNGWTCLPWAFTLVAGCPLEEFIDKIGHDGSSEPYPDLPGVKRGFHQQECLEVMQAMGFACTPIELVPQIKPSQDGPVRAIWFPGKGTQEECNKGRFCGHLEGTVGVLTGMVHKGNQTPGKGHAVAWNGKQRLIYDDRGGIPPSYQLDEMGKYGFSPATYWKVQKVSDA